MKNPLPPAIPDSGGIIPIYWSECPFRIADVFVTEKHRKMKPIRAHFFRKPPAGQLDLFGGVKSDE